MKTQSYPVLLVDDEESVLSSEEKVLRSAGIDSLHTCQDSREVLPFLEQTEVEAIWSTKEGKIWHFKMS